MNDNDAELEFVRRYLKTALPPWPERSPAGDLWPRMLGCMQERQQRFGWFESALAAAIVAAIAAFPQVMLLTLFHL